MGTNSRVCRECEEAESQLKNAISLSNAAKMSMFDSANPLSARKERLENAFRRVQLAKATLMSHQRMCLFCRQSA